MVVSPPPVDVGLIQLSGDILGNFHCLFNRATLGNKTGNIFGCSQVNSFRKFLDSEPKYHFHDVTSHYTFYGFDPLGSQ
jgi:hypothetical protein